MKWLVSDEDFDKLTPSEKKFFRKRTKTSSGKSQKDPHWASYGNLPKLNKRARRKCEIFCGGFLYFYDNVLIDYLKEVNGKVKGGGTKLLQYFKTKVLTTIYHLNGDPTNKILEKPG